jgi:hypothetical protein
MLQHHQPKHDPERIWVDKHGPLVATLRTELQQLPPDDIARRSGATLDGEWLRLAMLFEDYRVDTTDYVVLRPDGGEVGSFVQSLVLTYLSTADGGPPANRWVTFRDLPSGSFFNQAFQGSGPDRLAKRWQLDMGGFDAACRALGGTPIAYGDAGFAFRVLPRLDIAAIYWLGDEDFSSKAAVLFDAAADSYMNIEGLAILGGRLVERILAEG